MEPIMYQEEPKQEEKKRRKLNFNLWSRKADRRIMRFLQYFGMTIIVLIFLVASYIIIQDEVLYRLDSYDDYGYEDEYYDDYEEDYALGFADQDCNMAGINVHGTITTYISNENYDEEGYLLVDQVASEDIMGSIQGAEEADNIKAIVVEIDSYGGYPVAAEEIASALKKATKPTVALIREGGVSAGYWVATGADIIFASKNSDVGSIGITMSYLDNSIKNTREGLKYIQLSSGKFKDTGDPNKPLTNEEKNLLMRDVNILNQNFIQAVAENRKLAVDHVIKLADGSSMLGQMAFDNGLIDRVGSFYDVEDYLKEIIGEEAEFCWQ